MENKNTPGTAYVNGVNTTPVGNAPRKSKKWLLVVLLVLLIAGGVATLIFMLNRPAKNGPQFNNSQLNLEDIAKSDFKTSDELSILGQLNIEGGFAITPTSRPNNAKVGQLYYDQTTNLLSYYNGTEFIELTGQDINVGSGLASNDGVLTNTGVLSLQGQTGDVTLTAGAGITISGTTISASSGGVGGSGTAGKLVKFTGAQTIGDSLLTESGTTVSVGGNLTVTGGLSLTTALSVANGGTGASSLAANGVLVGNGTGAITSVTAAGAGLCLQSTAGAPAFAACPGGGGGVTSLNGLSGALTVANASAAGSTITIDDATTAAKGIASFNSTNFTVTSGAVNTIQSIATSASPTFVGMTLTGDLAVNGGDITSTGGLTIVSGGAGNVTLNSAGTIDLQDSTTITGDLTVRDSSTPTKQYRFRTGGGALDLESGGASLHLSTWDNADFTGTQRKRLVLVNGSNAAVVLGEWDWYTSEFGSLHHQIRSDSHVVFNDDGLQTNLTIKGDTDAGLFFAEGFTDRIGIGTITPGYKLDVNGTLGVAGLVTLTSAGTADTSTYLCRNSSNQIATCNSSGAGVAFVQGGNSFGATATLGTNDNNDLVFERNNTNMLTVSTSSVALASGLDLVLQGANAYITNKQGQTDAESFGDGATVAAVGAIAIGSGASAGHIGAITIGHGATSTANNQLVIGGNVHNITNVVIGNGVTAASPTGVVLQSTSGSGTNIAGSDFSVAGGQSTGNAFGGSINFMISPSGASGTGLNGLTTVATIGGAAGAALFKNATDSTSGFRVQSSLSNNVFVVDTQNARVGIGASATATLDNGATGLNIIGALRLSGAAGIYDNYVTPGGSTINSRFSVVNSDIVNFDQVLALGVTSASSSTSRGITVLDARTVSHQPTIAVLSPNENQIAGFSWDGSNTDFLVKNSASSGGTIGLVIGSTTRLQATTAGADVTGVLGVSSLGTADTATYICRNSSNALATCSSTGTGVAFVNGGNSLSGTATLGTNDANTLNFETNNATRISISSTGDITIGTSDTTGSLLVLDIKTGAGDPTGTVGAMYYNSASGQFRCYLVDHWRDCVENSRTGYHKIFDMESAGGAVFDNDMTTDYAGGAIAAKAAEAGRPGILQLQTSASATAWAYAGSPNLDGFLLGNNDAWRYTGSVRLPSATSALSTGTQRYTVWAGFMDSSNSDSTDGCNVKYSDNVNTGKWLATCSNGGTPSTCDTGVTVATDTWYKITVDVNAAGNSAVFTVNGSSCTITTNIPTTAGNTTGWGMSIAKSVGTTDRHLDVDYAEIEGQLGSVR